MDVPLQYPKQMAHNVTTWRKNVAQVPLVDGLLRVMLTRIHFYSGYLPDVVARSGITATPAPTLQAWDMRACLLPSSDSTTPRADLNHPHASYNGLNREMAKQLRTVATLFGCTAEGDCVAIHVAAPVFFHLAFDVKHDVEVISAVLDSMMMEGNDDYSLVRYSRVHKRHMYGFLPESADSPTVARRYHLWQVELSYRPAIERIVAALKESNLNVTIADDVAICTPEMQWNQRMRIAASDWIGIDASTLSECHPSHMQTTCQAEFVYSGKLADLQRLEDDSVAPLTIFTWHAQSAAQYKQMACGVGGMIATCDMHDDVPILSMAIRLSRLGDENNADTAHNYLINVCDDGAAATASSGAADVAIPPNTTLLRVASERELILAWRNLLVAATPDVLHNPMGYLKQWRWLWCRLGASSGERVMYVDAWKTTITPSSTLMMNGRLQNASLYVRKWACFSRFYRVSVAMQCKQKKIIRSYIDIVRPKQVYGQCDIDVCYYEMLRDRKVLTDISMASICAKYDMPYAPLPAADATRQSTMADATAMREVDAAARVVSSQNIIELYAALARIGWMSIDDVDKHGQQFPCLNQMCVEAYRRGFIIESSARRLAPMNGGPNTYDGAHVFESREALYACPVFEFDFVGYFPSILRQFGFCFTTWVVPFDTRTMQPLASRTTPMSTVALSNVYGLTGNDWHHTSPIGKSSNRTFMVESAGVTHHFFIADEPSLTTAVLDVLVERRAATKCDKSVIISDGALYDTQASAWISTAAKKRYKVLEAKEIALKLYCNATYGVFASEGELRCAMVGLATTSVARRSLLDSARAFITWEPSNPAVQQALLECAARARTLKYSNAIVAANARQFDALTRGDGKAAVPSNPYGISIVSGDSDSLFLAVQCILPEEADAVHLSPRLRQLATDVGLDMANWISETHFAARLKLPLIKMEYKQLMSPFFVPNEKKRYAAMQWSSLTTHRIAIKSIAENMPDITRRVIRAMFTHLFETLDASKLHAVATQEIANIASQFKRALVTVQSPDAVIEALIPLVVHQRTSTGSADTPARTALKQLASYAPRMTYAAGEHVGLVTLGRHRTVTLRHIAVALYNGDVEYHAQQVPSSSGVPNTLVDCRLARRGGGGGEDIRLLPDLSYYITTACQRQLTELIQLTSAYETPSYSPNAAVAAPSSLARKGGPSSQFESFMDGPVIPTVLSALPSQWGCGVPHNTMSAAVAGAAAAGGAKKLPMAVIMKAKAAAMSKR